VPHSIVSPTTPTASLTTCFQAHIYCSDRFALKANLIPSKPYPFHRNHECGWAHIWYVALDPKNHLVKAAITFTKFIGMLILSLTLFLRHLNCPGIGSIYIMQDPTLSNWASIYPIVVCKLCVDYQIIAALALEAPWLGFRGKQKPLYVMQDPTNIDYVLLMVKPDISGHNDPRARSYIGN
jgi:hypothetical protein